MDVLLAYSREVLPHKKTAKNLRYNIASLERWWGDKLVSDVTAVNCRAYAATKRPSAALSDLKRLQSAINHWHREHGPLAAVPKVTMPAPPMARDRWLTKREAAKLLREARKVPYLGRLVLLGLHTGSRPGVLMALKWSQIDLERGVMQRRVDAQAKNKKAPPVRLGRKILMHLRRWHKMDGGKCPLVIHYDGRQMESPHGTWRRAVNAAGLRNVTPHTLRHTRATWLMQRGADLWAAAGHLGMTVKTLEAVYGHHHPDFQSKVADL